MLDFFSVIAQGGLILFYFQDQTQELKSSLHTINEMIKGLVLQERGGSIGSYEHENSALKMIYDNQFQLYFVVGYQKILKLAYLDKFLTDIQRHFTDIFHDQLKKHAYGGNFQGRFHDEYSLVLQAAEEQSRLQACLVSRPRTFQESEKSKKNIGSMVEHTTRFGGATAKPLTELKNKKKKKGKKSVIMEEECNNNDDEGIEADNSDSTPVVSDAPESAESREASSSGSEGIHQEEEEEEDFVKKRELLMRQRMAKKSQQAKKPKKEPKKGKEARQWDLANRDASSLDYSRKDSNKTLDYSRPANAPQARPDYLPAKEQIGTLRGNLRSMEVAPPPETKSRISGLFSSLVGGRTLEAVDVAPALDKLRDLLISKNVAAEIAAKLCHSVQAKLVGKHIGTFSAVSTEVRAALTEALVTLLTPKRRLDILRDVRQAQSGIRPYVITFAGVNGVGKSTNLAKVCFWLVENNYRVLIAACDTFRAGAVEQLRTHVRHLNALHPEGKRGEMVSLYEQGYGKDAADIARVAIEHGRKNDYDVVLVDTAGRMQDNEPLMRALAKLITVNNPDLTLFVGEALVGNEAVDQLVKFNRALANYTTSQRPNMIDGILLTKFDTIDDKVGAAISMSYITGQPIVFVGVGQTYADLRALDAQAVVNLLMK